MKLELLNIKKSFGNKEVLKGINICAESGKAIGILGRNGAGKTTTIRILMNVFPADCGSIIFDGKEIDYNTVSFGYLPEERGLYPKKKIIDQLIYFAELKDISHKNAINAVNYWLERLGMSEYRNKRLDTLSKGNQQKIQLITALAHNPQIIILDEPFSGLDPVNALLLKEVVKEEIAKGKIVLFSSHQMNYIEEFCDSIAIMNGGRITLSGDISSIKRNYPRNKLCIKSSQYSQIMDEYGQICSAEDDGSLILHMKSPDKKMEIMKKITEKFDVDEIKIAEPTLNDIFVEYTGNQI